jgi:hypothetical protein
MQRCLVALNLPTRCRVPSPAHDLPRLSPVGTKPDAHRIGSRATLGLALRAAELQVCMPNTPNGRETSPRIPLPPGRATVCLSSHVGSRPLNRWGQAALMHGSHIGFTQKDKAGSTGRVPVRACVRLFTDARASKPLIARCQKPPGRTHVSRRRQPTKARCFIRSFGARCGTVVGIQSLRSRRTAAGRLQARKPKF